MIRATRAQTAANNRERVLDAAREVFRRKGFHGSSVDEIAEEAGFSKGVVYSQFGSKDDMFLALLERRIEQRARENLDAIRSARPGTELATIWDLSERIRKADPEWTLVVLEYRIHAARNPALNRRYAALHQRTIEGVARTIEVLRERRGVTPRYTPTDLARFTFAIDNGYALEQLVAPPGATIEPGNAAMACLLGIPFEGGQVAAKEYAP
jgi:AcrR family transcriptional regulator